MTGEQENKNSMYLAVKGVLNENESKWTAMPAFVNATTSFFDLSDQVQAAAMIQQGNTKGITDNKQQEEDEMIAMTLKVAGAVRAFATVTGNQELKAQMKYSASALKGMRDSDLLNACQHVHDVALEHVDGLADYMVTAETLTQLNDEVDDFRQALAAPRNAITRRSEATSRLADLFKEADGVLNDQLDALMEMYREDKPFYNQYQAARIIVDLG
jgi:hypothetical protein